jgi:hypothetical protein
VRDTEVMAHLACPCRTAAVVQDASTLYVGEGFTEIGGQSRHGIAVLPTGLAPDAIFANGFETTP